MERVFQEFKLTDGRSVFFDLISVVSLESAGPCTQVRLANGDELEIEHDIATVESRLGELRLHGNGTLRINLLHVVAIESCGAFDCLLRLSGKRTIAMPSISAGEMARMLERSYKYPWQTIHLGAH